jgi:hypothetical protein
MLIPDPGPGFFPIPDPDPGSGSRIQGSKRALDPGSGSALLHSYTVHSESYTVIIFYPNLLMWSRGTVLNSSFYFFYFYASMDNRLVTVPVTIKYY